MFRKVIVAGSIVVLAAGSTACATKGFVRQNVGEVNDKVDSLGRSVEETQERTRRNEGRITEVDQRAGAAEQAAAKANTAAAEAQTSANAANSAIVRGSPLGPAAGRLSMYRIGCLLSHGHCRSGIPIYCCSRLVM